MDTCPIAPYKGSSGSLDFTRLQLESWPRMKPFLAGKPSPREWPRFPPGTLPCAVEEPHGTELPPARLRQRPCLSPRQPQAELGGRMQMEPPRGIPSASSSSAGPWELQDMRLFRSALCVKGCKSGFPCPAGSFPGLDATLQAGGSGAGGLCGCWVCCGRSGADWSWLCFTRREKPSLGGRFLLSGAHP